MNIVYIKVSSADQNTNRQYELLKTHTIKKIFEEKISGKDTNRPQLKDMLSFARQSDTIYIESISQLARNTRDFLNNVEERTAKEVGIISLKESIDTSTPAGRFMLTVFAALRQLERDTIKQRQREGIDITLKSGKHCGRPSIKPPENFAREFKN